MDQQYPKDVFVSLQELLSMEAFARGFSFQARKQKVKSILGGKHASKLRGRGMDFEEVRKYVPGDDIRNIDWKVTARTQKTHSKVFSEEKEKPAFIIVDQSRSMYFGSVKKTKSVVAAEFAALAAFRIQKEGDRVGGLIFAENEVDIVSPKRDRRNILRFLERLEYHNRRLIAREKGDRERVLTEALIKTQNIVTHDYLVIVISDFIEYSTRVSKALSRISRHNDVILVKIFDEMERTIPKSSIIVGDGEKQLSVDGNPDLAQRFQEGFDSSLASFEADMKRYRIPLLTLNTSEDVDVQLKNGFRQ